MPGRPHHSRCVGSCAATPTAPHALHHRCPRCVAPRHANAPPLLLSQTVCQGNHRHPHLNRQCAHRCGCVPSTPTPVCGHPDAVRHATAASHWLAARGAVHSRAHSNQATPRHRFALAKSGRPPLSGPRRPRDAPHRSSCATSPPATRHRLQSVKLAQTKKPQKNHTVLARSPSQGLVRHCAR